LGSFALVSRFILCYTLWRTRI